MQQNELQHYGVKGMRWGITRAKKKLSNATTSEGRDKAVARLEKHRAKASKKVTKLEKKHVGLQKDYDRAITKTDPKIADLQLRSNKLKAKSGGIFTSERRSEKLMGKAAKLDTKITQLKAVSESAKAEIAKNERMQAMFKQGIKDIDEALIFAGRKYING